MSARAGLSRARQASCRCAAMLPMQVLPAASRRVHARSGRRLHEARYAALPYAAARQARQCSARALRNEAPLRCGAQARRNAAGVLRYAEPVPRYAELVLRNVGLEQQCAAGGEGVGGAAIGGWGA